MGGGRKLTCVNTIRAYIPPARTTLPCSSRPPLHFLDPVFPPNHPPALTNLVFPSNHSPTSFPPKPKPKPPETEPDQTNPPWNLYNPPWNLYNPPAKFTRQISRLLPPNFPAKVPRQDFQMPYKLSTLRQSITNFLSLQSSLHPGSRQQQQLNK